MDLSSLVSVFVPTHIIMADTNPYLENKMIETAILSSHDKLGFGGAKYYIYPDVKFATSHPELQKIYLKNLNDMRNKPGFENINIEIVEDCETSMRKNWIHFINKIDTPYSFFLEHDWEFVKEIPTEKIIQAFEKNQKIGYIKLNHFKITNQYYPNPKLWDWIFEPETDMELEVPLMRLSFFSGWPHFTRTSKCREFYIPELVKHCPDDVSRGLSHLEKDMKKSELYYMDKDRECKEYHKWPLSILNGCPTCEKSIRNMHDQWGCFMLGEFGKESVMRHTGEWCRKK